MDIITWLTEPAYVNRHVSPLYFIIVTIISLTVLVYASRSKNNRAIWLYGYGVVVWLILELGLFLTGIREYNISNPYPIIIIIGGIEDPGWVCLAYMVAEKMIMRKKINKKEYYNNERS